MLAGSNEGDLEIRAANHPGIRLITVPNVGTQEPQKDFHGNWTICRPETVGGFSAVGYFFGRQLHQTLGVPVGLINDSWGGSACEAWIRRDLLAADAKYAPLLKRWEQIEKNYPKAKAEYDAKQSERRSAAAKAKAEGKQPPRRPQSPDGLMRGNSRPGNIYNGVLKPTIGYGIRGAIWYQGESNAGRAYQYRDLFPLMIKSWRDEWGSATSRSTGSSSPTSAEERPEPSESDWAELREAQTMTMSRLPHTGEAVIIDLGEGKDIHPRNKLTSACGWPAGPWLATTASRSPTRARPTSPWRRTATRSSSRSTTSAAASNLRRQRSEGFTVAGSDRKFVWAKARVVGSNKVEVWSDKVAEPVAVRYAWADNPVCNLYSAEGLPATPFRTDDWPGVTINNK